MHEAFRAETNPHVPKTTEGKVDTSKLPETILATIAGCKRRRRNQHQEIPPLEEWHWCPICGHPAVDSLITHLSRHGGILAVERELGLEPGCFQSSDYESEELRQKLKIAGAKGEAGKRAKLAQTQSM